MESVVFDGKEYTKASVLAERFRYTQDYLGQLCRGKKVDARLVGRAWYINLESLNNHRSARYKDKTQSAKEFTEISPKITNHNYLSRIDVEPVLKGKSVRLLKSDHGNISEQTVTYENDDHSLIPKVHKTAPASWIPIKPAEAELLRIKEERSRTTFKPDPLPEVYLSGRINIEGLPEEIEEMFSETESEAAVATDDFSNTAIKIKPEQESMDKSKMVSVRKVLRKANQVSGRRITIGESSGQPNDAAVLSDIAITQVRSHSESHKKPSKQPYHFSRSASANLRASTESPASVEQVNVSVIPALLLAFIFAGLFSLFIFSVATEVLVVDSQYSNSLTVDAKNLKALVEQSLSR